jgi:DNA-binding NarL/FixJ family response regulator
MSDKLTVLLADDHKLVRLGFRRLLEDDPEIEVVAEAGNGLEAIHLAQEHQPRVAVLDMSMPELDGIQATREIRKRSPGTAVLILSMYSQDSYVRNAMEAGASGYLLKDAIEVDLTDAVKTIAAGGSFLGPGLNYTPGETPPAGEDEPYEQLTQRERQILQMIAQGNSNKQIASLLNLSVNTVSVHRANLMEKMKLHKTADLVRFAIAKGLVVPEVER